MKKFMLGFATLGLMIAAPVFAADAKKASSAPVSLDGQSYVVEVKGADGKTQEDTLTFKDGKVECALSKAAGYQPAQYSAKKSGLADSFMATLTNDKGDKRVIHGSLVGGKVSGSIDVTEGGKASKMTFAPKPTTVAAAPKPAAPAAATPAPAAAPVTK